jgi:hypothetical protein
MPSNFVEIKRTCKNAYMARKTPGRCVTVKCLLKSHLNQLSRAMLVFYTTQKAVKPYFEPLETVKLLDT